MRGMRSRRQTGFAERGWATSARIAAFHHGRTGESALTDTRCDTSGSRTLRPDTTAARNRPAPVLSASQIALRGCRTAGLRTDLKTTQLHGFLAVYQTRSFTDAADRLGTTQGAVSIRIRELEDCLGTRLFERSNQGVVPTPAGDRFYERALRLARALETAREDVMSLRSISDRISAGVIPTFSRTALAPAIMRFRAQRPEVALQLVESFSGPLAERTARRALDFAIVPAGPPDLRLVSQHIAQGPELFATSTHTARVHLRPVTLCAEPPLKLVLPTRGNARRSRLESYLTSVGVRIAATIEMDTMMGALELVSSTDWTGVFPAALVHPELDGSRLKLHPIADPPLLTDYALITPASRPLRPAAQVFAAELCSQIAQVLDDWARRTGAGGSKAKWDHIP